MDIDVTELLTDPDTGGAVFDVIRRLEVMGDDGQAVITEQIIFGQVGAIYPAGNNSLVREEAYTMGVNSIEVVTQFRLRMSGRDGPNKYQPDLVVWGGDRYIVKELNEFTQYGAGFVKAGCLAIDFNNEVPQPEPVWLGTMDFSQPVQSGLIGAT